jgi:para-nitrobenzyl esterase
MSRSGQRRSRCALLVGLLCAAFAVHAASTSIPGDPVSTTAGRTVGVLLPSGVRAYLGVPYARPPVDELRWAPPQPARWNGVWNADRFGPECIQILRPHNINHYFGEEPTGENCLYLNIWSPPVKANAKRPVIVFIYGGGGTVGSAGIALYQGEEVARHGAVFVSFNYRLGILGFMAHPELSQEQAGHSGNYGYLDQNAALRWIHDNVARFGGDPEKVLISGQSFGAGSVAAQLFSPLSRGLFRAAAMWSACNFESNEVTLKEAEKTGLEIEKRLSTASLAEMRNVPADRILAVQEEHQLGADVRGVRLPPTVDGLFWPSDKREALERHEVNAVPILVGSNGDDLDAGRFPLTRAKSAADYRSAATALFGAAAAAEYLRLFPVDGDAEVVGVARKAAQAAGFLRQSQTCARLHETFDHQPTYIELFTRRPSFAPGVRISDLSTDTVGAYHTADVPFWFGTLEAFNRLRTTRSWSEEDRRVSNEMMATLIRFAESGNPATPVVPWPAWSANEQRYIEFGATPRVEPLPVAAMEWLASQPAMRRDTPIPGRTTRD